MIKIEDLCERHVYKLNSRNLDLGVWVVRLEGFIGIREKFGHRFLDSEVYYGPKYGTAKPLEFLDVTVPDEIILNEYLGKICSCGRAAEETGVQYNPDAEKQGPYNKHCDDGSLIELFDPEHEVYWQQNTALFEFLDSLNRGE